MKRYGLILVMAKVTSISLNPEDEKVVSKLMRRLEPTQGSLTFTALVRYCLRAVLAKKTL